MKKDETRFDIGSSVFWLILIPLGLIGLVYLSVWSFFNESLQGFIISTIFSIMIISGIIFSSNKIFSEGNWSVNCFSFTLGFIIYGFLGWYFTSQSILSIGSNFLLQNIAGELPQFAEFLTTVFTTPLAEELFWMIVIVNTIVLIMDAIAKNKSLKIAKNKYLQMIVIIIISGTSFAIFHVGKLVMVFFVAAFIFRMLQVILVWGDKNFDIVKGVSIGLAFSVGSHIGNNFANYGFSRGITLLNQYFLQFGWIIYLMGALIFLTGINFALEKIGVKTGLLQ
jgi:hypothetical protein